MTEHIPFEQPTDMCNTISGPSIRADEERDAELRKLSDYADVLVEEGLRLRGERNQAMIQRTAAEATAEVWYEKATQLQGENNQLRGHDANQLARKLANRTGELADARRQIEDLRDLCSEHSADYARESIALEDERDEMRGNYESACKTIAAMHAAAVGEACGPTRGVVKDVADLRSRCLAAEEALTLAIGFNKAYERAREVDLSKSNARWHDERRSSAKAEAERDEAREIARCLKRMYGPQFDDHGHHMRAALGLPKLPAWLTNGY